MTELPGVIDVIKGAYSPLGLNEMVHLKQQKLKIYRERKVSLPMILCVDHEMSNIMMLSMLLGGEEKYNLAFSHCGGECLELIQYEKPDLIILDFQLPDMNGVEICRMLKESEYTRDILVVVTTSLSSTNEIRNVIRAGADGYIIRPYHYRNVLNKVTELLAA